MVNSAFVLKRRDLGLDFIRVVLHCGFVLGPVRKPGVAAFHRNAANEEVLSSSDFPLPEFSIAEARSILSHGYSR
jgi:hypothetical protein